jgi:hypothetical protein
MLEETHAHLLAPRLFAARMTVFLIIAICVDTIGLVIGAFGYHFLEGMT